MQESEIAALTADAGDSFYPKITTLSAKNITAHHGVEGSIRAVIATYIQSQSFFSLHKEDSVKQALQTRLQEQCKDMKLIATIEACTEVTHSNLGDTLLAELAAQAGRKEIGEGSTKRVEHDDPELWKVVEYFDKAHWEKGTRELEELRQQKLNEVEIKRTEAENEVEIERTKAEAQPVLEKLREKTIIAQTDSRLRALQEDDRVKADEAERKKQQAQWEKEAIERNSAILEMRAQYEAEYKRKRIDEEMTLNRRWQEEELALVKARLDEEKNR